MYETYNNTIAVPVRKIIDAGIITEDNYKKLVARKKVKVLQRGCLGTPALADFSSFPERFRRVMETVFGDPKAKKSTNALDEFLGQDTKAIEFYSSYEVDDNRYLPAETIKEYYANACVLNAIRGLLNYRLTAQKRGGNTVKAHWDTIAANVKALDREQYPHSLPMNDRRLKDRYNQYQKGGYEVLIHRNFCNQNSRIVDERLEMLILSVYCMTNKPYASWVAEDYERFTKGEIEVVNIQTGEIFNRMDFYNEKRSEFITVSDKTCWNYINQPKNRLIVDSYRAAGHRFLSTMMPHMHRHAPNFSLSKISLDDRDLPRKMHNGERVKAYYAYDVASGCLIGASYSIRKDVGLFIGCIREMFRFIDSRGWGMPLEMEVEHHLVSNFKDDLMKAGVVFPFVHWCAPSNSQEKHAEQLNRQKKYGYEKRYQDGIGRWYGKLEANQTGGERIYDEANNRYTVKEKTYSFEQLVADDIHTIALYNSGLHRDQKKYKGKTRMQVMEENLNPNLASINRPLLVRYIGECTTTSIQRNMYCQVQHSDYMLPNPEVLGRLQPNNYTVQAYYMPMNANGENQIDEVYLYQHDDYLCEAKKIVKYNTSHAEWTDADTEAMTEQAKYIAQTKKLVKDGREKISRVQLMQNLDQYATIEVETAKPETATEQYFDHDESFEADAAEWGLNSL